MPPTILLSCESISKTYGVKPLFTDLSVGLAEGDHVGLVGPNGSGKSTLLKIMAGLEEPDEGTRSMRRQLRVGYVPQEPLFDGAHTIEEVLAQVLIDEGHDPHDHSGRTAAALSLGEFPATDQSTATLSGGWKKRLAIVRSLMLEPDVLLMDEPTNHLDVEGILWLERLLRAEARAFLVVSHDRRFLEAVTSRMIELNRSYPTGAFEAKGNYSDFLEQRDAALHAQANYEASLANRVRREVEWLRRGPKARTTKAKSRIDSAGRLIEELNSADARKDQGTAGINFTASGRRSKQLVEATQLCKSLGGRPIIKNLDLLLGPGQRIGLLGPNGSGKSTLLKLIAGALKPDAGTVTTRSLSARVMVPASGLRVPAMSLSKVLLPLPFGPNSPIRWPGPSNRSRFVTIGRPPSDLQSCMASTNCFDLRPDAVKLMPAVPWSFRASALFSSSIKRPAESIRDLAFVVRALGPRRSHSTSRRTRLANDAS